MLLHRVIISLVLVLLTSSRLVGKEIVDAANYEAAFASDEKCFVIHGTVDLEGRTIHLKKDCIIFFSKDGKLVNGQIVGDNTQLRSLRDASLGVLLSGSWLVHTIDDAKFDQKVLTDNQILDNISTLQSNSIKNTIILHKPHYKIELSSNHKYALILKSNTVLKSSSNIEVMPNDLIVYYIISVGGVAKVRICGGSVTGDVETHKYKEGTTSEWGFGISISMSKDVEIKDVTISKCTGDGIYIGAGEGEYLGDYSKANSNVSLHNVISKGNRRQGISITYADGITIKNCIFSNTGMYGLISPGCGLDIEPNKGQAVRNVFVLNSEFFENGNIMDASVGGYKTENGRCNVERIMFKNCSFSGKVSIRTGSVVMKRCSMGTLEIHLARMPKEKVLFDHCSICNGSGVIIRSTGGSTEKQHASEYRFLSCHFDMNRVLTPAMFSSINHKGNEVADFIVDNCFLSLPKGNKRFDMVQQNITCEFRFSNCQIYPQERTINLNDVMYNNCRIKK